jgi:hypothetical protein
MDIRILNRTEFIDLSKGMPGVPSIMITFQLPDWRVGSVVVPKAQYSPAEEKKRIAEEVAKMGKPSGELITI